MRISNLAGVFTGQGFAAKGGRYPSPVDCGYLPGPITLSWDGSGRIDGISQGKNLSTDLHDTIDCTGLLATPGFVDSHTHAIHAGQRAPEYFLRWAGRSYRELSDSGMGIRSTVSDTARHSDDALVELLRRRLRLMLMAGTTTVEVKSGYADSPEGELRLLRLVKRAGNGDLLPRVCPTFLALHGIPPGSNSATHCDRVTSALPTVVKERLADQVDSFPEPGFVDVTDALRFSKAAARMGLAIKVHADQFGACEASAPFLQLGARSIDHLEHITDRAVSLLSRASTVATLLPAASLYTGLPYANARRLIEAGARVALATDFNPGTAPVPTLPIVLLLAASQMRMTPAELLCACTYNGAAALGVEDRCGTLEIGRIADISLWSLETHPTDAFGIAAIEEIVVSGTIPALVIRGGVPICSKGTPPPSG